MAKEVSKSNITIATVCSTIDTHTHTQTPTHIKNLFHQKTIYTKRVRLFYLWFKEKSGGISQTELGWAIKGV